MSDDSNGSETSFLSYVNPSDSSHGGQLSPADSFFDDDDDDDELVKRTKRAAPETFSFLGSSESVFLAILFSAIAILLPIFFYYVSTGVVDDYKTVPSETLDGDTTTSQPATGANSSQKTLLSTLLPYIRQVSVSIFFGLRSLAIILRPLAVILRLAFAIVYPVVLAATLIIRVTVLLPWRITVALVKFFYPLYVFGAVAVILSSIIGITGRAVTAKGNSWFARGKSVAARTHVKRLK